MSFSIEPVFPRRAARSAPLSLQIRSAAETLAANIEGGEYSELMPDQRADLRQLAMTIHSWSDRVETAEIDQLPRLRQPSPTTPFTRFLRRLRQG